MQNNERKCESTLIFYLKYVERTAGSVGAKWNISALFLKEIF